MSRVNEAEDLDERVREFDRMFESDTEDAPDAPDHVGGRPTPVSDAPFMASDEALDEQSETPEDNMVKVMQDLLLRHEDTQVNRVEDPDLVRVLGELRTLAHSNIADVFQCEEVMEYIGLDDEENEVYKTTSRLRVKDITTLPREVSACIQSVKVTSGAKGDTIEVKMYDKQVSLDKLMRFHGAYMRDNEQQNKREGGVMDLLLSSIGSQGLPKIENNNA